jgi:Ca2+-binding RTX toxin-like protein
MLTLAETLITISETLDAFKTPLGDNANDPSDQFSLIQKAIRDAGDTLKNTGDLNTAAVKSLEEQLGKILGEGTTIRFENNILTLNLPVKNQFDSTMKLPTIRSKFNVTWSLDTAKSTVAFNDVELDLGDFISKFIKPILDNVQTVTKPIQPIVDALTKPIPLFSKLGPVASFLDANSDGNINLLELAKYAKNLFPNAGFEIKDEYISAIIDIVRIANSIPISSNIALKVGSFNLGDVDINLPSFDLSSLTPNILSPELNWDSQLPGTPEKSFFDSLLGVAGGGLDLPILRNPEAIFGLLLGKPNVDLFTYNIPELSVKFDFEKFFPLLGPLGVNLKGSIGASANLGFGYDSYGLQSYRNSGYSNLSRLANGFYIRDWIDGKEVPEANLEASIRGFGALELLIARGGVGGGIYGNLFADLVDNGSADGKNGKIRWSELSSNFLDDPTELFDLSGKVETGLEAYAAVGWGPLSKEWTWNSKKVTLAEFGKPDKGTSKNQPPILATMLDGGVLRLNMGPNASDRKTFDTKDRLETFDVASNNGSVLTVTSIGFTQNYSESTKIIANAGEDDDIITIKSTVFLPTELKGGNGNDQIYGGNGNDLIEGDAGWDQLFGRDGNDTIRGGSDSDSIRGENGDDLLYGDSGNDNLDGGDGNDILEGGQGFDLLVGLLGNDILLGGEDNDFVDGGQGSDILDGGNGDDVLFEFDEQSGDDILIGGSGNDRISGGLGNDTASYETSPNGVVVNIDETKGFDSIATEVTFSISAATATDGFGTLDSFRFNRDIFDEAQKILVPGTEEVSGSIENIVGSQYDDVLIGNIVDNLIQGKSGNDLIIGSSGVDILDGGDGTDTVSYRRDSISVFVNLEQNTAADGFGTTDILLSIENILGSNFDDRIIGSSQINWLFGGAGNDLIEAGNGNDVLYGEAGDDSLLGDSGNDKLIGGTGSDVLRGGTDIDLTSYITALSGVIANLSNTQANTGDAAGDTYFSIEDLEGSQFNDILTGDNQANHLWGLNGNDFLDGWQGADIMEGGLGNDTYNLDNLGDLLIEGLNEGDDTVNAFINCTLASNLDNLFLIEGSTAIVGNGNDLDNLIFGNTSNNTLDGSSGNDILYGGLGLDTLIGGLGNDRFVFNSIREKGDTILDFAIGNDQLVLTDLMRDIGYRGSNPIAEGFISARQVNSGLTSLMVDPDGFASKTLGSVPFIFLNNVSASSLLSNPNNFLF